MSNRRYVITGATGNIGKRIAESLLAKGQTVRVIGRNQERLQSLVAKGAEAFVGSVEDPVSMKKAFQGASAAFLMIPPNYGAPHVRTYQKKVGEIYINAVRDSGLKYLVNLSSVGAHLSAQAGPINGLHDFEESLNKLPDVHIVHLRPAFFMENHLHTVGLIKQMGILGTPLTPVLRIPMIATQDIAAVAVDLLLGLQFKGKSTQELLGPKELSMADATAILGNAIGKNDLKYVQFPYADAEKAMQGMGMSKDVAKGMVELYKGFNEKIILPREQRSPKNTTPTTLEEFSKTFAKAYQQN